MKHVLIVTYGRSGSTLLQGLLNAIDGWLVRGENLNFGFDLFRSYRKLKRTRRNHGGHSSSPTDPWYGSDRLNLDRVRSDMGTMIHNVVMGDADEASIRCCGFKEIRYFDVLAQDVSGNNLSGYLDFLLMVLSPCQILFLTRSHEQVLNSGWWRKMDRDEARSGLQRFDDFAAIYATDHAEDCFVLSYQDMVDQSPGLTAMFNFLGEEPLAPEAIDAVLARRHSVDIPTVLDR